VRLILEEGGGDPSRQKKRRGLTHRAYPLGNLREGKGGVWLLTFRLREGGKEEKNQRDCGRGKLIEAGRTKEKKKCMHPEAALSRAAGEGEGKKNLVMLTHSNLLSNHSRQWGKKGEKRVIWLPLYQLHVLGEKREVGVHPLVGYGEKGGTRPYLLLHAFKRKKSRKFCLMNCVRNISYK